ncbi:hypothetical protein LTR72_001786 [Exophiala xenobiotica]|nr:hypothetical protein LTR92_002731 [Exophiala xenobiotica]KAK5227903.1 hypothetical protein LTR72_001786 [Exophiala xenobiotica]KAK5285531.1 hypothetical protein LTR14_010805 [Exophiala xenobiotica]KAK5433706.1 hypothetical protein LTR18_010656 [Exophiala xenobiotica]KAK5480796.1 hypothetical protein LTR55_007299 [Exophiala xenobiotica]
MGTKVLKNGTVLAFDDKSATVKVLPQAHIVIENDHITAILEPHETQENVFSSAEVLDVSGLIVSPGFVNTHCHTWQTAYRTLCPDITLAQYFGWVSQRAANIDEWGGQDIYISCLEGYLEGINAGITSYVEHAHCNWGEQVMKSAFEGAIDSGARIWWCYHPVARAGFGAERQVEILQELRNKPSQQDDLIRLGLAVDGLDGMSAAEIQQTKKAAIDIKAEALTSHYLGGPWPFAKDLISIAEKHELYKLDVPYIWSHAGFLSLADMDYLRQHDQYVSITPESEMHYGHGQDTSRSIHDQAALGIDTNFTFSNDILLQARLWLQNMRGLCSTEILKRRNIPKQTPMAVVDAFLLATRNGGRSLRRDDIGVLKVGAKADIVCFDGSSVNMLGWTDPVAAIILHSNVGDIKHVMIGGQFRKKNGQLVLKCGEWEDISKRFKRTSQRIQEAFRNPPPLPEAVWGRDTFEDNPKVTTAKLTD